VTAPAPGGRIDDNRDAADAAAMFVEDLGNEVRVAYDGETGVDLARSFRPDLVLFSTSGWLASTASRRAAGSEPSSVRTCSWSR
jgi:hypothetical protein